MSTPPSSIESKIVMSTPPLRPISFIESKIVMTTPPLRPVSSSIESKSASNSLDNTSNNQGTRSASNSIDSNNPFTKLASTTSIDYNNPFTRMASSSIDSNNPFKSPSSIDSTIASISNLSNKLNISLTDNINKSSVSLIRTPNGIKKASISITTLTPTQTPTLESPSFKGIKILEMPTELDERRSSNNISDNIDSYCSSSSTNSMLYDRDRLSIPQLYPNGAPLIRRLSITHPGEAIPDIDGVESHKVKRLSIQLSSHSYSLDGTDGTDLTDDSFTRNSNDYNTLRLPSTNDNNILRVPLPPLTNNGINLGHGLVKRNSTSLLLSKDNVKEIEMLVTLDDVHPKAALSPRYHESPSHSPRLPIGYSPRSANMREFWDKPAVTVIDDKFDYANAPRRIRKSQFSRNVEFVFPTIPLGPKPGCEFTKFRPNLDKNMDIQKKLALLCPALKESSLNNVWEDKMRESLKTFESNKMKWFRILKTGAYIYKYSDRFKAQKRYFKISDTDELLWGDKISGRFRKESLCDVEYMQYGIESERFGNYDISKGRPWLCFTLKLPHRTIDLECPDEQILTNWYLGIQALTPMSFSYTTRGGLLWKRMKMKVQQFAYIQGVSPWQILKNASKPVKELIDDETTTPIDKRDSTGGSGLLQKLFSFGSNN